MKFFQPKLVKMKKKLRNLLKKRAFKIPKAFSNVTRALKSFLKYLNCASSLEIQLLYPEI